MIYINHWNRLKFTSITTTKNTKLVSLNIHIPPSNYAHHHLHPVGEWPLQILYNKFLPLLTNSKVHKSFLYYILYLISWTISPQDDSNIYKNINSILLYPWAIRASGDGRNLLYNIYSGQERNKSFPKK